MKKEINLLPRLKEESEQERKLKRVLTAGSPVALAIYGVFLILIYIYWTIQVSSVNDLKTKIVKTEEAITSQKETESLYRGAKTKIAGISLILGTHINYASVLSHIEQIIPAEISLTSLDIKENGNVEISLQAPNSAVLTAFLNALLDQNAGGKYFSHASLTSLVLSRDGSYLFSLTFQLNPGV